MFEFTVRGTTASKCNLSLRYVCKTESYSSGLYSSFQHENHSKKGTPLSQQTGKLSRPRTSFIYKQRVRAPPSSTSRGRWPILTWKIAKVQVCFVLNNETISPGFMNLSDGHNRNRVWNMLGKRVWSDKGGHLKLSNHVNCWNEERHVIGENSNHKYPAYPQDQIEQMLTTNAITQAERKFLVSQNALTSISHKDDLTSNLSWDDQAKW